jgi:DNA-binding response OmpR family regulator
VADKTRFKEETMVASPLGTLLLVEDEDRLRDLVAQFLRNEGFGVVEAADGPQGVERFRDSGPFDLVLADLNLPVFSGVEVCRRIKRSRPDQRVMICSAAVLGDHELALNALGIDHFLTKPYHPEDLIAHILQEIGSRPIGAPSRIVPLRTA